MEIAEPQTPSPPQEGETANLGFFCHLEGDIITLSHVGIDSFGNWARTKVDKHPEVIVEIAPEKTGYEQLNLIKMMPRNPRPTKCAALADTGAQMVVLGANSIHAMGLKKSDLIPVGM